MYNKEQLKSLLFKNKFSEVFKILQEGRISKERKNELFLLERHLQSIQQEKNLGTISSEDAWVEINKIILSILNFIDDANEAVIAETTNSTKVLYKEIALTKTISNNVSCITKYGTLLVVALIAPNKIVILNEAGEIVQQTPIEGTPKCLTIFNDVIYVATAMPSYVVILSAKNLNLITQLPINKAIRNNEYDTEQISNYPQSIAVNNKEIWLYTSGVSGQNGLLVYDEKNKVFFEPAHIQEHAFDMDFSNIYAFKNKIIAASLTIPASLYFFDLNKTTEIRGHDVEIISDSTHLLVQNNEIIVLNPNDEIAKITLDDGDNIELIGLVNGSVNIEYIPETFPYRQIKPIKDGYLISDVPIFYGVAQQLYQSTLFLFKNGQTTILYESEENKIENFECINDKIFINFSLASNKTKHLKCLKLQLQTKVNKSEQATSISNQKSIVKATFNDLQNCLVADLPLNIDARNNCSLPNVSNGFFENIVFDNLGAKLNGRNSFITFSNYNQINFNNNQVFSISFWLNIAAQQPDTKTPANIILEKWMGKVGFPYAISYQRDSQQISFARFGIQGSNREQAVVLVDIKPNQFTHYCCIKNNKNLMVYKNGVLASQSKDVLDHSNLITANQHPLVIGCRSWRAGEANHSFFKGQIGAVKIFKIALSTEEIKFVYEENKDTYLN